MMRGFFPLGWVLLLTGTIFFSCHRPLKNDYITISGKVVNPYGKEVKIYQTYYTPPEYFHAKLDSKGRFSIKIPAEKKDNSFVFEEGVHITMFYAQPGDSIYIFVNSKDFDGSLTYGGDEAAFNNLLSEIILINEEESDKILSIVNSGNYKQSLQRYLREYKTKKFRKTNEYTEHYPRLLDNSYKQRMLNLTTFVTQWLAIEQFNAAYRNDKISYQFEFPFDWGDSIMPLSYDLPIFGTYYFYNRIKKDNSRTHSLNDLHQILDSVKTHVKSKDLADAIMTMTYVRYVALSYPTCDTTICHRMRTLADDYVTGRQYNETIDWIISVYASALPGEKFRLDSLLTIDNQLIVNDFFKSDSLRIIIVPELSSFRLGHYDFIFKNPEWGKKIYFLYNNREEIPVRILSMFYNLSDSLFLKHHLHPYSDTINLSPFNETKNYAFIIRKGKIMKIVSLGSDPQQNLEKNLKEIR